MAKKLIFIIALSLFLTSCAPQTNQQITTSDTSIGKCTPGSVDLVNYGDKGKRLANCFVEYPGEPSRQDKSYYIIEDICGQFTKEFMENILGQKLANAASSASPINACSYYLNDKDYVMLVLDYYNIADQKTGREAMGQQVIKDAKISMDNFYTVQANGSINDIYLILSSVKFLRIERASAEVLPGDKFLQFAEKLGQEIKDYK